MSNKNHQAHINELVVQHYQNALDEWMNSIKSQLNGKRLRSCSAKVYETDNYYVLRSYDTFVAVIDKNTNTLYDALRYAYGYTSTSSHHICKFRNDYADYDLPFYEFQWRSCDE